MEFPRFSPWVWALAFGLAGYAAVLARRVDGCAGGADSSGYLIDARLLASGRVTAPLRTLPEYSGAAAPAFLYVPLGFTPAGDAREGRPIYAPGFPLLLLAAGWIVGSGQAANAVLVLSAVAGLLLTYALGRAARLPPIWAAAGSLILAASPLYLAYSLQAMSDLPALAWVSASILAAWKDGGGDRPGWSSLVAGFAFAFSVLIRPTDALALAPLALALGPSGRRWRRFLAGGIPGAVFLLAFNRAAYGRWFATGYGDVRYLFSASFIAGTVRHYIRWLPLLFSPVVIAWLVLPAVGREDRRSPAILGAWGLAFLGFYSAYRLTSETWWYLRFILPAAPALLVGGLVAARRILPAGARMTKGAALVLILALSTWLNLRLETFRIGRWEAEYPAAVSWLRKHLPERSVIAAMQVSGALYYYSDFVFVRWDQLDSAAFRRVAAAAAAEGRPVYAALFPFELEEALNRRMAGRWTRIATLGEVTVWRYDGTG